MRTVYLYGVDKTSMLKEKGGAIVQVSLNRVADPQENVELFPQFLIRGSISQLQNEGSPGNPAVSKCLTLCSVRY
jgi:hypothetical protein